MDVVTTLTIATDDLVAWEESTEIGTLYWAAVRDRALGSRNCWTVSNMIEDEDVVRQGSWITHEVDERVGIERVAALRCGCLACIEDAHEDAQDEEERRVARQARALAYDLPERP